MNKQNYIRGLMSALTLIMLLNIVITYVNFNTFYKYNVERLHSITKTDGTDLTLICTISDCRYISKDGVGIYKNVNGNFILKKVSNLPKLNFLEKYVYNKYYLKKEHIHILPNMGAMLSFLLLENIIITILILLGYTVAYIKNYILVKNNLFLESYVQKSKLEGRLTNIASESAYHEMTVPLEVIRVSIDKLHSTVLKIDISHAPKKDTPCYSCNFRRSYFEYSKYYKIINDNIARLDSVMQQMSLNKHTKYDVTNKDIYDLIETTVVSLKMAHMSFRFNYAIKNDELLKRTVATKIDNGTLLNILNNQLKNALEAGANNIIVDGKLNDDRTKLLLIITDNGSGIKNVEDGDYDKIFKLGYSTKDKVKDNMEVIDSLDTKKTIYFRIKEYINNNLFANSTEKEKEYTSYRGFGLYITRQMLREAGGDIYVYDTSTKGTVFVIELEVNYME